MAFDGDFPYIADPPSATKGAGAVVVDCGSINLDFRFVDNRAQLLRHLKLALKFTALDTFDSRNA